MKKHFQLISGAKQKGMSLIEILVSMTIVAVGLLGMAGLQMNGLRNNQSAYLRSQASILAADMADRMRLNRARALAGAYSGFSTDNFTGSDPGCSTSSGGCTETQLVTLDMVEWTNAIEGAANLNLLPNGTGTITQDPATGIFTITISWQEKTYDTLSDGNVDSIESFAMTFAL